MKYKTKRTIRGIIIAILLIAPIYQQIYWIRHGMTTSANVVLAIAWFAVCTVLAFSVGYLIIPPKKL